MIGVKGRSRKTRTGDNMRECNSHGAIDRRLHGQKASIGVPIVLLLAFLQPTVSMGAESIEGWTVASPEFDQDRIAALDEAIANDEFRQINSIVVIRDGELLVERYYNGAGRSDTHNPRSVGKTFAATILGIAIEEGHIESLDQPLSDFYDLRQYDNYSDSKAGVTLRQLLTMTSAFDGFDFEPDSVGNEEYMYPQDDWVEWTLNLPMASDRDPGDAWRYFTAGIVVLGDIIDNSVPGGLEAYAEEKLFSRIGVSNYQWQHTPQGVANTAGGIQLTPLGFARYGELHGKRGRWANEAVLPAAWVDEMLEPRAETTVPGERYGYLWWHKTYDVDGESWPVAYCSGNGGNKIFVFDDRDIVVVVTASAYGQPYMHTQVDDIMTSYVLPSIAD